MPEEKETASRFRFVDLHPQAQDVRADVLAGLSTTPKRIPPKYFYDRRGSELFEQICRLPEYYLTRTEFKILKWNKQEIAAALPRRCWFIEFGSGSSRKVELLIESCDPMAYVPIDISASQLRGSGTRLAKRYSDLDVLAVHGDYTQPSSLPDNLLGYPRVAYFPGSSIGNFTHDEARRFLLRTKHLIGHDGRLLVGVDKRKSPDLIEAAYNDADGVTSEFNLNVLKHLNDRTGANFAVDKFAHRAKYAEADGRLAMHLRSLERQVVLVGNETISIAKGELIHTEDSFKYSFDEFENLAATSGLTCTHRWTDDENLFMVLLLKPESA